MLAKNQWILVASVGAALVVAFNLGGVLRGCDTKSHHCAEKGLGQVTDVVSGKKRFESAPLSPVGYKKYAKLRQEVSA